MPEFPPVPIENAETAQQFCKPVCVPIFIGKDGTYGHQAMGLLFAVADSHFLVTCRHAVYDVVARGAGLWIPDDNSPGRAQALTPNFLFPNTSRYDLAVMKLPDRFVGYFSAHRFARAVETFSSYQPEGTSCVMFGMLATESETWGSNVSTGDEKLRPATFFGRTTTVGSDSEYIDECLHFLINADNLVANSVTDGELRAPPESFRGLSGTPVFAVNDNPFEANWNAHDYKIIGIQSSVITLHREKHVVMKVMRLEAMFSLIAQSFPSVAETLGKLQPVIATKTANRIITPEHFR